jgi:hypothetical protein
VYRSPEEIRDLIIEHLTHTRIVPTTSDHNWHIEPQEAVELLRQAALQQEGRTASVGYSSNKGGFLVFSLSKLPIVRRNVGDTATKFAATRGNRLTQ